MLVIVPYLYKIHYVTFMEHVEAIHSYSSLFVWQLKKNNFFISPFTCVPVSGTEEVLISLDLYHNNISDTTNATMLLQEDPIHRLTLNTSCVGLGI